MIETILDELIKEAQQNPEWKAEQALRCAKKELLKAQEPVYVKYSKANYGKEIVPVCGNCDEQIREDWKCCPICGKAVKWIYD